ncbi:acetolactate decarboxylase [Parathermosynechococcus lividus]
MVETHVLLCAIAPHLKDALEQHRRVSGQSLSQILEQALSQYLNVGEETLFQTSTISALVEGVYRGDLTIGELKQRGDFGLGTFDDLDGEMVVLEGEVYQLRSDGTVAMVPETVKTPFATVTVWNQDVLHVCHDALNYDSLQAHLKSLLPSDNLFYAIRIEGTFPLIKTRTVSRQTGATRLIDAAAQAQICRFEQIRGTLVGFWVPLYMQMLNVPGFHFHFLSHDRSCGGHLLDCLTGNITIAFDETPYTQIALPDTDAFRGVDLTKDTRHELEAAEQDR